MKMNTIGKKLSPLHYCAALILLTAQGARSQAEGTTYADLAPILSTHCVICHTGSSAPLGLRLDNYASIIEGSSRGPVVRSGDPSGSEIIRRIKGISQPRMPMTGPPFLSDNEITLFENWVTDGLLKGRSPSPANVNSGSPVKKSAIGETVTYADVAPLFARSCVKCHTTQGVMGAAPEGYLLTSYAETLSASDRVRVVPGNPYASELIRRIRGQSLPRMPFDGPPYFSDDEINLIETWISQGARDESGKTAPSPIGAEVRLQGVLQSGWRIDGLDLIMSKKTRIDKSPQARELR